MKKCKDHKGQEFASVAAMCDFWNISPFVFYKRKNKLKWSMEKTLTTPQNEQPNRNNNVTELLQRHGIIRRVQTFKKLIKDGYTIEQAIAEIKQQIADEIKERARML